MLGNENVGQFRIIFLRNGAKPPFFVIGTVRAEHRTTPTGRDTDTRLTEQKMTTTTNFFTRTFAAAAAMALSAALVVVAVGPIAPAYQAPLTQVA